MDHIHLRQIADFLQSDLCRRMQQAKSLRREWGFNFRLPESHGFVLQGVIDCAFLEEDAWVLLDYKTDHIESDEAFVQRHQQQLCWYAEALEVLTGIRVKELYLYALGYGRTYAVPRIAVELPVNLKQ